MIADFPKHVFDLLQQQLASTGRVGATRWYVTAPIATSPATGGGISIPTPVRFTDRGIALAMYGVERTSQTAFSMANTAVRVQIGGTEDLFVDGLGGPAFAPFQAMFGSVTNWTPLMRRVTPGVDWIFTYQNNLPAPGPPTTINPQIIIAVIADADIARMTAAHEK